LPQNEVIGKAFRENVKMYPELCIRELVANALIHQDFSQTGNSVMIEIYDNRIEITNPGEPLINTDRFLSRSSSVAVCPCRRKTVMMAVKIAPMAELLMFSTILGSSF